MAERQERTGPRVRFLAATSLASVLLWSACGDPDTDPGPFGTADSSVNPPGGGDAGDAGSVTPGSDSGSPGGTGTPGGTPSGSPGGTPGGNPGGTPGGTPGGNPGGSDAGSPGGGSPDGGSPGGGDAQVPAGDGGATGGPGGSEADYKDPGKGPWEKVTGDKCLLDTTKLADSNIGVYAIFRFGKLCHLKGGDSAGAMYSATKTLGGSMAGRAAYLLRDVARAGPGTGTIKHEDKATDWLGSVSYNREATLAHVMAMCGHSSDLTYGKKTFTYDTVGSTQINTMIAVTVKAIKQIPGSPTTGPAFVKKEIFDKMGMTSSNWSDLLGISTGWNANLSDMGKLGTMLVHDGWYGGERLIAREWVYRMSHPAFEDANTSYGNLAWLNHRGNAAGIGGDITSGSNSKDGDLCAPAAFWPTYPHIPSGAPDCRATSGTCKQTHDVGVFSAQGANGQFIVMHPGLDLVIAARNFSGGGGPIGLWKAVRPALVAMDPMFKGNETAFCEAYGAGNYAPNLAMPRHP